MNKITQYLVLFIVFLATCIFGAIAYVLASDTLVPAFAGQNHQYGTTFTLAYNAPNTLSKILPRGQLIDTDAIKNAIEYNGVPLSEIDGNLYSLSYGNGLIEFSGSFLQPGESLTLNAKTYNHIKKTPYNLPNSILLENIGRNTPLTITSYGRPKDQLFSVHTTDETLNTDAITWYATYGTNANKCFTSSWDTNIFEKIDATQEAITASGAGENNMKLYRVHYDTNKTRYCIIAGINGKILRATQVQLDPISLSSHVASVVTNNEIKTQVSFSLNTPLFLESELANSGSYNTLKEGIIKNLHITPNITITPEDIKLHEREVIFTKPLDASKEYTVHIDPWEDIYGRHISYKTSFTPKEQNIVQYTFPTQEFNNKADIKVTIFKKAIRENFEFKMCRLTIDGYLKVVSYSGTIADLSADEGENCVKTNLHLQEGNNEVSLAKIFDTYQFSSGVYAFYLRNPEERNEYSAGIELFSVVNSRIIGNIDTSGNYEFQVFSYDSTKKLANIPLIIHSTENTGSIRTNSGALVLGKTDSSGILRGNIAQSVLGAGNYYISTASGAFFGYNPMSIPEISSREGYLSLEGKVFHENMPLRISGEIFTPISNSGSSYAIRIENTIQHTFQDVHILLQGTYFSESIVLPEKGNYIASIIEKTPHNIRRIGNSIHIGTSEELGEKNLEITFRGINFQGTSPRNIKKNILSLQSDKHFLYEAPIDMEAIIRGVGNGDEMKNRELQYTLKKVSQLGEQGEKILASGTLKTDRDAVGYVRFHDIFESNYFSNIYILEITIPDSTSHKEINLTKTLSVDLPDDILSEKNFEGMHFSASGSVFKEGEKIVVHMVSNGKKIPDFHYVLSQGLGNASQEGVLSGTISSTAPAITLPALPSGLYTLAVYPILEGISLAESPSVFTKVVSYISSKEVYKGPGSISINKTAIEKGHTLQVSVFSPYTSGKIEFSLFGYTGTLSEASYASGFTLATIPTASITPGEYILQAKIFGNSDEDIVLLSTPLRVESDVLSTSGISMTLSSSGTLAKIPLPQKLHNKTLTNIEGYIVPVGTNLQDFFGKRDTPSRSQVIYNIFSKAPKNINSISSSETSLSGDVTLKPVDIFSVFGSGYTSSGNLYIPLLNPLHNGSYTVVFTSSFNDGSKWHADANMNMTNIYDGTITLPKSSYPGDAIHTEISFDNNSNTISEIFYTFRFPGESISYTGVILANIGRNIAPISLKIPEGNPGIIPYELQFSKHSEILSTSTGSLERLQIPGIGFSRKISGKTSSVLDLPIIPNPVLNQKQSQISLFLGNSVSAFLPTLQSGLINANKLTIYDAFESLLARQLIVKQGGLSDDGLDGYTKDLLQGFDLSAFLTDGKNSFEDNSRLIETILNLKKISVTIPESYRTSIETFIASMSGSNDTNKQTLHAYFSLLYGKQYSKASLDSLIKSQLSEINTRRLAHSYLLSGNPIPQQLLDTIATPSKVSENNISNSSQAIQSLYTSRILSATQKYNEGENMLLANIASDGADTSSIQEKLYRIQAIISHMRRTRNIPVTANFFSLGLSGKAELTPEKNIFQMTHPREIFQSKITLTPENKKTLYYELYEKNILEAPQLFPEKNSDILSIHRSLKEKTTEETVSFDTPLKKGSSYSVYTELSLTGAANTSWKNLVLKIPKTAVATTTFPQIYTVNGKENRFLYRYEDSSYIYAIIPTGIGDAHISYTYFLEPKISGDTLLPAEFVYFIDNKKSIANTSHQYLHIQ